MQSQGAPPAGTLDATVAATNSASLPPPAPLPAGTLQALGTPAAPAMAPLPPQNAAAALPALPAAPIQGSAAPLVTLPSLPTTVPAAPVVPVTDVTMPVAATTVTEVPAAAPFLSDVPPVVMPPAPAPVPDVIEHAKAIAPGENAPLVSTASGGPIPPTIPNSEIVAIKKHPLPAITPSSPLIPATSLANTVNQRRQITTLPGSGGDTNYAYATIGGPDGPATPLITPPTVLEPQPGHDIGKDYPPLQAVMPQPEATPLRWDEPESAFGTPVPSDNLNYYLSKDIHQAKDLPAINPMPDLAEVIVLRGGQEFQGLILERGDIWRIELLNGTIITVPGNKVSHMRKVLAAPTSTPSARNKAFPVEELYKERPAGNFYF